MSLSDPPPSDPSLPPGSQLAQYRLVRAVGAGGMGVVYLARDDSLDRDAAVKVLKVDALATTGDDPAELEQRFLREARSAAKLSHPNVAAIYQAGRHGQGPQARLFIAMEWLDGGSLWDHLRTNIFLDWRDATAAIRDAALGLAAAHAAGIIHRDIKPSNLMRTSAGVVKLVDFGLAREYAATSDLTHAGHILGTPTYLSPEQCRGEPATPLSDVYSLGCSLFHLLASRPPFESANIPALLHQQINEPLPDVRRFADDIPPAVCQILQKSAAKRPQDRHASAAELATELSGALDEAGESTSVQIPDTLRIVVGANASAPLPVHNLPNDASTFIGREREMAEIATALSAGRMTTLLGAGGTGKTRLSVQAARRSLSTFPGGIWIVELAGLPEDSPAAAVAQAVATTVNVKEAQGESSLQAAISFLQERDVLLVVDNCEHLIDGAAQTCDELLQSCPRLRLLATSRQPLRVPGERTLRVPSLPTPDADDLLPEQLQAFPAVQLFVERAAAVRPGFAVTADNAPAVARICRRLDGIPLAIELAAARMKVLSPQQIASRLGDAFKLLTGGSRTLLPRQQTLKALIDWSYNLLEEPAQILLVRMSIFSAGCSLEAVEGVLPDATADETAESGVPRVTSAPGLGDAAPTVNMVPTVKIAPEDVLDLVSELVEHSLVVADERDGAVRYRMLETIRQYGAEKLAQRPEEAARLRERHIRYYTAFVVAMSPRMHGATQTEAVAAMTADHDNLRAALDHAIQDRQVSHAVRLGAELAKLWNILGHMADGIARIEQILALNPPENADLARLLDGGGILKMYFGDPDQARDWFERALKLARPANDPVLLSLVLNNLGTVAKQQGDLIRAGDLFQQTLEVRQTIGDPIQLAGSYNNLGIVAKGMGQIDRARELLTRSLELVTQNGDKRWTGYGYLNLAELELEQGDVDTAQPMYEKSLEILQSLNEEWGIAYAEEGVGKCLLARGDLTGARQRFEQVMAVCRKFGDKTVVADQLDLLAQIALRQGDAGGAASLAGEGARLRLQINDHGGIARSLELRAELLATEQPAVAVELLGCAAAQRKSLGQSLPEVRRIELSRLIDDLKQRLGEAAYAEAFASGEAKRPAALL